MIFDTLMQREKLGSTGIGHGIAIPHGKLPKLEKLFGLFARLERPIDFELLDGQPVDLVFLLLAPEGAGADHLKALASVARLLRDPDIAHKLREFERFRSALCRADDDAVRGGLKAAAFTASRVTLAAFNSRNSGRPELRRLDFGFDFVPDKPVTNW